MDETVAAVGRECVSAMTILQDKIKRKEKYFANYLRTVHEFQCQDNITMRVPKPQGQTWGQERKFDNEWEQISFAYDSGHR